MTKQADPFRIPLPRGWPGRVKSPMLHVISLVQYATAYTRGWAARFLIFRRVSPRKHSAGEPHPGIMRRSLVSGAVRGGGGAEGICRSDV